MRLEAKGSWLLSLALLGNLVGCGDSKTNSGFLGKRVDEVTPEDGLSPEDLTKDTAKKSLWTAIVTALKTNEFDLSTVDNFKASIGAPAVSGFVTDATARTAYSTDVATSTIASASEQKCATAPAGFTIVNPGTVLGLSTGGFKVVDGAPAALAANVNVYLTKYKLKSTSEAYHYAFVTIPAAAPISALGAIAPDGTNYGYPVAMYAHAGTTGLSYEEIALAFGDAQVNHVIVAPVFPGEPVCKKYDTGTTTCTGDNVIVAGADTGTQAVYQSDVTDFLGSYECVKSVLSTQIGGGAALPTVTGSTPVSSENLSTKVAQINKAKAATAVDGMITTFGSASITTEAAVLRAWGISPVGTPCGGFASNATAYKGCMSLRAAFGSVQAPLTYAFGLGRGGNVVNLALSRAGVVNSILGGSNSTAITALATAGLSSLDMFSCAATAGAQSTYHAGFNKIVLESWVKGSSAFITAENQTILDTLVPGNAGIKATIKGYVDDATLDTDDKKAAAVASYVKGIDGLVNLPTALGGLQNWGKVFTAKLAQETLNTSATTPNAGATYEDAQGAFLILHGRADKVSNISNSQIFSGVLAKLSAGVQDTSTHSTEAPQLVPGENIVALEVAAGTSSGVTDFGHVSNSSFLTGKTVVDAASKAVSTIDTTAYQGLTPSETIGYWLGANGACRAASNGLPDATNNPAK